MRLLAALVSHTEVRGERGRVETSASAANKCINSGSLIPGPFGAAPGGASHEFGTVQEGAARPRAGRAAVVRWRRRRITKSSSSSSHWTWGSLNEALIPEDLFSL